MLQFTYKLKIAERVKAKCSRHPRYNPEKDGRAGIRGACSCCFSLYDLYQARIALDAAQREFIRRAAPWARPREPRSKRATDTSEEPKSPQSEAGAKDCRTEHYPIHVETPCIGNRRLKGPP